MNLLKTRATHLRHFIMIRLYIMNQHARQFPGVERKQMGVAAHQELVSKNLRLPTPKPTPEFTGAERGEWGQGSAKKI